MFQQRYCKIWGHEFAAAGRSRPSPSSAGAGRARAVFRVVEFPDDVLEVLDGIGAEYLNFLSLLCD